MGKKATVNKRERDNEKRQNAWQKELAKRSAKPKEVKDDDQPRRHQ